MATQVQFRRGTTTQNNAFTGANGELSVDTDIKTIRLHDGVTGGGAATMLNTTTAQTALNKTFSTGSIWNGSPVALAYGGTGASLSAIAGAVAYSGNSGLALTAAGTSGQVLVSGGTGAPVWVNATTIQVGTSNNAITAQNIAGGSAGQLVIQSDTGVSSFITAGATGTFLKSAGAGYAPTWAAGAVTLGSSTVALGDTLTSMNNLTTITMNNGSYGGGTITAPNISGSGPWTVTVTGITSTTGINAGQNITATAGTGSLFGGNPTNVVVASVNSPTSITVTVTGGTTPTAGTITSITTFGFLQVPAGTTAQRPYQPAVGMIRYNTSQTTFEGYSAGAWSSLGGVTSVDKFTFIQAETGPTVSNGDLDFFAENAAGNAAQQVGQWNRTNLKDYTGTIVGTQTTQNVFNVTATTVNAFGAATSLTIGATSGTTTVRNGIAASGGVALAAGTALTASHGNWAGEQNKIQWHSDHLYFQNMNSGRLAVFRQSSGNEPCSISNAGVITCASIQTTSDIKLKENIVTIGNASEIINSLRGVTFDWKASKKKSYGLIAQEVEVVLPELVEETVDDSLNTNSEMTKTVDYDKIVSVLIEGWKEQQSQIKDLQEEVASLKLQLGK